MISEMEYHKRVRSYLPTTLALFGLFFSPVVGFSSASSQTSTSQSANSSGTGGHGGAATSVGAFSGHSGVPPTGVNGIPPTGISGIPPTGSTFSGRSGIPPTGSMVSGHGGSVRPNPGSNFSHNAGSFDHHRHHGADDNLSFPYLYAVPVPYAADLDNSTQQDSEQQDDDESDYQGGPTVFDRRGTGRDSYAPAPYPGPAHAPRPGETGAQTPSEPPTDAAVAADPPQPTTILVFKDGHQVEVANYAIVSKTLYDLTPDHPRKIALADLDLTATQQQNDDRGVTFQLPPFVQAN